MTTTPKEAATALRATIRVLRFQTTQVRERAGTLHPPYEDEISVFGPGLGIEDSEGDLMTADYDFLDERSETIRALAGLALAARAMHDAEAALLPSVDDRLYAPDPEFKRLHRLSCDVAKADLEALVLFSEVGGFSKVDDLGPSDPDRYNRAVTLWRDMVGPARMPRAAELDATY